MQGSYLVYVVRGYRVGHVSKAYCLENRMSLQSREMNGCVHSNGFLIFPFLFSINPRGTVLPIFRVNLISPVKPLYKHPHKHV